MAALEGLLRMEPRSLWRFTVSQGPVFGLLLFYIFLEYIRPQSRWEALAILPWGQASILACLALFFLYGGRARLDNVGDALLVIYTLLVVASSFNAYRPAESWSEFSTWVNWIIAYFLISRVVNTSGRFLMFQLGWMCWNLNMAQYAARSWALNGFRFRSWGVTGSPGWFRNSGEFGIEMTLFLPITICFVIATRRYISGWKRWLLYGVPPVVLLGVVGSSSRGALVGVAAVGLWMLMISRRRVLALASLCAVVAAMLVIVPPQFKSRFEEMGSDPDSLRRLTYWADGLEIMQDHPFLGIGYNNWLAYYSNSYFPTHALEQPEIFRRPQVSHNPFIQAGSELGFPGLIVYTMMIMATIGLNFRTRQTAQHLSGPSQNFIVWSAHGLDGALMGYLASGFFVTVLYYPFFWINLAMTVSLYRLTRDASPLQQRPRALPRHQTGPSATT